MAGIRDLRDLGELEGAVARPFQTGGGGQRTAAFGAARMLSLFGLLLSAETEWARVASIHRPDDYESPALTN